MERDFLETVLNVYKYFRRKRYSTFSKELGSFTFLHCYSKSNEKKKKPESNAVCGMLLFIDFKKKKW